MDKVTYKILPPKKILIPDDIKKSYNKKLDKITEELERNLLKCSKCSNILKEDAKFCAKCGSKVVAISIENKCNGCGHTNKEGAKFCSKCGQPINDTSKCTGCGHKNKEDAKFCVKCGNQVNN